MTEKLSALLDGELDEAEIPDVIDALASEPDLQEAWRGFNLIADHLRASPAPVVDVVEAVVETIDALPAERAGARKSPSL